MVTCLQASVLQPPQVDALKQSITTLSREHFFYEETYHRFGLRKVQPESHRYENPQDSWFPVVFGENGAVISEEITAPFSGYQNAHQIQATVRIALQWMSQQQHWHHQTRQMAMSIMQHHQLQKGQSTKPMEWHRDLSEHTLVILLDDEKKWEGGNFLFQEGTMPQETFLPKKGYGIFFANENTQHALTSLTALEDGVDRTILTLHEKSIDVEKKGILRWISRAISLIKSLLRLFLNFSPP